MENADNLENPINLGEVRELEELNQLVENAARNLGQQLELHNLDDNEMPAANIGVDNQIDEGNEQNNAGGLLVAQDLMELELDIEDDYENSSSAFEDDEEESEGNYKKYSMLNTSNNW